MHAYTYMYACTYANANANANVYAYAYAYGLGRMFAVRAIVRGPSLCGRRPGKVSWHEVPTLRRSARRAAGDGLPRLRSRPLPDGGRGRLLGRARNPGRTRLHPSPSA
ncbi:hypothetical protein GCM10010498_39100 [Streptomyces cavourensis]|nr:hypothetical protein GCM10010498_39100 [Streptomyces cavourensis]